MLLNCIPENRLLAVYTPYAIALPFVFSADTVRSVKVVRDNSHPSPPLYWYLCLETEFCAVFFSFSGHLHFKIGTVVLNWILLQRMEGRRNRHLQFPILCYEVVLTVVMLIGNVDISLFEKTIIKKV